MIRIEQPGEAKLIAKAGRAIGKAQATQRAQEQAERQEQQAIQIAERRRAEQAARDWELQKMQMRSQQDFLHEQRMRQAQLEAEARAREWQTEKMELASRLDFEQDEKERIRIKAEYTAGRDVLDKKKDEMPAGEYERALFRFDSIYAPKGVGEAVEGLGYNIRKQGLFDFGSKPVPSPVGTPNPTVDNPLGLNIENIPTSQLPQAVLDLEAQNKFEVISPDGETETIDADQWPDYKAQGYILSQIKKLRTDSTSFLSKKVGTISDLVTYLKRPVGTISDLTK